MTYPITVAGVRRELPITPLNDSLMIAGFVILGDPELTVACAKALLEKAPPFDYMLAPEAKGIPLIHEMARQSGQSRYIVVRKQKKAYMVDPFEVADQSITTAGQQKLYLDGNDADLIRGKRVLCIDDVISTGGSMAAVENLVTQAGGIIAARMAILAEGEAKDRDDIIYLEPLPLFNTQGEPLS